MLNRTNRTLSATTHGLNLGTRTLAINAQRNNNGMTLRLRHGSLVVAHPSDSGSMSMKRWFAPAAEIGKPPVSIAGPGPLPTAYPGSESDDRTPAARSPRCAVAPFLQPRTQRVPCPARPQQGRVGLEFRTTGAREAASASAAAAHRAAAAG